MVLYVCTTQYVCRCMHVCVCDLARSLAHLLFLAALRQGSGPPQGAQAADQGIWLLGLASLITTWD